MVTELVDRIGDASLVSMETDLFIVAVVGEKGNI